MYDTNNNLNFYIGIVAPLGVDRDKFIDTLNKVAKNYNMAFDNKKPDDDNKKYTCKISDIINIPKSENDHIPESFKIFAKMQIFNQLRLRHREELAKSIIEKIKNTRDELLKEKTDYTLILIDQIKNMFEHDLLSHIYGKNYIQVGLFSSKDKRNSYLEDKFNKPSEKNLDDNQIQSNLLKFLKEIKINEKYLRYYKIKPSTIIGNYLTEIRNDCSSYLLKKDFTEIDEFYQDSGQNVSKIYHRSHFYFNLDKTESDLESQIHKFFKIILGKYKDYPTQSEFGISIATQTSVRSTFPNKRHVGAAILSSNGETISTGSIRAPSKSSNTKILDEEKINDGYDYFKKQTKQWEEFLEKIEKDSTTPLNKKKDAHELRKFINSTLDFHPCTHAEISAILDAAKLGTSIRGASFYTTLYPCHLCAKDIISAGIEEVVYLEAYPKSKNEQLYPHNITDHHESGTDKIVFSPFFGVGPERFHFYYSLENKHEDNEKDKEKWKLHYANNVSILAKETEVTKFNSGQNKKSPLSSLFESLENKKN